MLFNVLRLIDYLIGGKDIARKGIALVLASRTWLFVKFHWKEKLHSGKNFKSSLLNVHTVDVVAQKQHMGCHSWKFIASSHIAP